jgi:hypothetical protein
VAIGAVADEAADEARGFGRLEVLLVEVTEGWGVGVLEEKRLTNSSCTAPQKQVAVASCSWE